MNVQGDEPLLNIDILEAMIATVGCNDQAFKVAVSRIEDAHENNPSEVKVAISWGGRVRYASRAPIPFERDGDACLHKIHGVYLYTHSILSEFVSAPEGVLEASEKVEQLRCIENDIPLIAVVTPHTPNSVDTRADLNFYLSLDTKTFADRL